MNIYEKITKVILENCLDYKRKIDPFNRDFFQFKNIYLLMVNGPLNPNITVNLR